MIPGNKMFSYGISKTSTSLGEGLLEVTHRTCADSRTELRVHTGKELTNNLASGFSLASMIVST
jgi:hypothetical protein